MVILAWYARILRRCTFECPRCQRETVEIIKFGQDATQAATIFDCGALPDSEGTRVNDDPKLLRAHAVRLYALALRIRDSAPGYADRLVEEACELEDRASAIEEADRRHEPG